MFLLLYLSQSFLFYPEAMLVAKPIAALMGLIGLSGNYPSHIHFAGYDALICAFISGPLVAYITARLFPVTILSGRWIWLLPVAGALILSLTARSGPPQNVPYLPALLFETAGEGALGPFLFTYPICSAIGYSLGMILAGLRRDWLSPTAAKFHLPTIAVPVSFAAVLCVAVVLLHGFEREKITKWSQVRRVISALQLSRNAEALCSGSPGELPLTWGTMVQSLETRNCGGDHLLEAGAPPQPRSWTLEKVRVLDGPNAGTEGWVLAYGLLETVQP